MKRLIDHIYHFRDHTIPDIWHIVCVATTKYYLDRIFDKPQQKKGWTIMLALKTYLIMKLKVFILNLKSLQNLYTADNYASHFT